MPSLDALHRLAARGGRRRHPSRRPGRPRPRRCVPSPVRQRAEEHGIEVLTPDRPADPDFLERLRELAPDACPVVAYGALIPQAALDIPRHGWVNLHFSLLPAWRGAAPVQHAVMAGDEVTGASTFLIEAGPGHRAGLRRDDRDGSARATPPVTCSAGWPRAGAGLLVATMDGLADGRLTRSRRPRDGVSPRAQDRGRRRAGALGPIRPWRWTARCAAAPPRRAPGRRSAASASSSARSHRPTLPRPRAADSPPLAPGELRGRQARGPGRAPAVGAGRPRAGPAARQEGDGRGRLGPRRAHPEQESGSADE